MRIPLTDGFVDLDRMEVDRGRGAVRLTKTEHAVLRYLVERGGKTVERDDLARDVLGYRTGVETRALDTLVYKLRQKIEVDAKNPTHLVSVRGIGYRFEGSVEAAPEPVLEPDTDTLLVPTTSFVGRSDLVDQTVQRLKESRWLSLVGAGGIGKTRIADEVVRRLDWPGTLTVQVRSPGDAAMLRQALPPLPGLKAIDRVLLWVDALDLDPAAGEVLAEWLGRAPGLHLLVSTRRRLRRPGESVIDVPPLAEAEARALFVERARDVRFDVRLPEDDDPAWTRFLKALDGNPLAIELAARRLRTLDFGALATQVTRAPHRLTGPEQAFPEHQRSLEAVIGSAVDALPPTLRKALVESTVFRSPFGLDAAEAVLATPGAPDTPDWVEVFEDLVDAGMLRTIEIDRRIRFLVPEPVRSFVAPELGPDHPVWTRCRAFWLDRSPEFAPDDTWIPDVTLLPGTDDLRQHCAWALGEGRVADAVRLFHGLVAGGYDTDLDGSLAVLNARLLALDDLSARDRTELHIDQVILRQRRDQYTEAFEALAEARNGATPMQRARILVLDTFLTHMKGRHAEAELLALETIEAGRSLRSPMIEGLGHGLASDVAHMSGRSADAERHLHTATQLFASCNSPLAEAHTHSRWALLLATKGDLVGARHHRERSIALYARVGVLYDENLGHITLAFLEIRCHDLARARYHAEISRRLSRRITARDGMVYALSALGLAAYRSGDVLEAERLYLRGWNLSHDSPDAYPRAELEHALGTVHLDRGDPSEALSWLDRATPALASYGTHQSRHAAVRAEALARLSRFDEMREALAWVSESWDPTADPLVHVGIHLRTGLAWLHAGEADRARQALQEMEASPVRNHPWAITLRERLRAAIEGTSAP